MSITRFSAVALVVFVLLAQGPILSLIQPASVVVVNVRFDGQPADALIRVSRGGEFFSLEYTDVQTPGSAQFELPVGDYVLSVEHGAGYISLPELVQISTDAEVPTEVDVNSSRIFDPRERGYYSADLHVHTSASAPAMERDFGITNHGVTPVDQVVGIQLAAALDVMFISDHNTADGHDLFVEISDSRAVPYLLSEEITTTRWGHFNPIALNQGEEVVFSFSKSPMEFFEESRARGARAIQINHPLSSTFGYFFSQNQPEYDDSFELVEVFNGPFSEGDRETINRMFNFWNQGLSYVATGVSDDHDWKRPGSEYGTARTFVHIDGELSAGAYLESLLDGHAFVSHGPLIYLSVNEQFIPGDTIQHTSGQTLQLDLLIESVIDLDGSRVDLLKNGVVAARFEPSSQVSSFTYQDDPISDGWYSARIVSSGGAYLALTNPVWVSISQ